MKFRDKIFTLFFQAFIKNLGLALLGVPETHIIRKTHLCNYLFTPLNLSLLDRNMLFLSVLGPFAKVYRTKVQ